MWFAFVPCVWYDIQSTALPGGGEGCIDTGSRKRTKGLKRILGKEDRGRLGGR